MSNAFRNFINDIRQKVVEEPWFGRAVTDNDQTQEKQHEEHTPSSPEQNQSAEKEPSMTTDEKRAMFKEITDKYPPQPAQEQEQDIER